MRLKNLEQYRKGGSPTRMDLGIPLPKTPDGRVYRYSPNEKALPRHFVLGDAPKGFEPTEEARKRMKLFPRSTETVCPYSGVVAGDQDFTHPADIEAAKDIVRHAATADVAAAVHGMFRDMERKFASSKFLKVNTTAPTPNPKPRFFRRDLLRELVCDHCGRDYGVFAIGLFCPDCGAPNLKLHFAREIDLVLKQVTLADAQEGQEELAYRLMGNAHEDVLTAFEATLKAVYQHGIDKGASATPKPVRNDFQNIDRARARFAELGLDPFAKLTRDDLADLNLNIQKRHIIGHNLGVVDEKFADHAASARLGETVHLVGEDIRRFGALAQQVVDVLDDWLVTGSPRGPIVIAPVALAEEAISTENEQMPSDLKISPIAFRLAKWIGQASKDGQADQVDIKALAAAFSDVEENLLEEAVAELSMEGYVTTSFTMAHKLPRIKTTAELFATFDPILGLGNPVQDTLALVELVLTQQSVRVEALHQETGWTIRRFNPAVALLIAVLNDKSVSREVEPKYPARWLRISAEDRVALKRYVERHTR